MAHNYSNLYELATTGLRFFTVYGPWGCPDMALFLFTKAILADGPINVFNCDNHTRDFIYIDNIVEGLIRTLNDNAIVYPDWSGLKPGPATSKARWRIYKIGDNNSVLLVKYIEAIKNFLVKRRKKCFYHFSRGTLLIPMLMFKL